MGFKVVEKVPPRRALMLESRERKKRFGRELMMEMRVRSKEGRFSCLREISKGLKERSR